MSVETVLGSRTNGVRGRNPRNDVALVSDSSSPRGPGETAPGPPSFGRRDRRAGARFPDRDAALLPGGCVTGANVRLLLSIIKRRSSRIHQSGCEALQHVQGGGRNRADARCVELARIRVFCRLPAVFWCGVARLKAFAAFVEKRSVDLLICMVRRVMSPPTRTRRGSAWVA